MTRYAARWAIEVAFSDAEHVTGVGEARNRTQRAVERTVPFGLQVQTLVVVWYHLTGHSPRVIIDLRNRARWHTTKTHPGCHDMLIKLRRALIAGQYRGDPPPTADGSMREPSRTSWCSTWSV